ncbi:hypothetical protein GCM10007301_31990 [Azorhizobium oxalatiphilum]|uniref:CsbD-like domain-containing protein n=1 Tax=Azorhizobium oxalatiphilum TaxID=980631 RepID=A0A917FDV1_9HYPH|nr:CsbD family protein [Azorhizobium oxalatiphilum]GGF69864.1 hypothetical protein GCM10007301_31990 [Azorhizobium oxalatiphilum]
MDTSRIEGAATEYAGRAKEAIGALADDKELRAEGYYDQASGAAERQMGRAKDHVAHNPVSSLMVAGLVGLAVGFILGRG